MFTLKNIISYACLSLFVVTTCLSQEDINESVINSIEVILEKELQSKYHVTVFDVDKKLNTLTISENKIKGPYKSLSKCFIFIGEGYTDSELNKPKGYIGVFKKDSILWKSEHLTEDLSTLGGYITAMDELNNDGNVEFVISQNELPGSNTPNYLWIFSWDGEKGKIINEINQDGESILAFLGEYQFVDLDKDGIYEIQGEWYKDKNSNKTIKVTYSWNGSLYGKWGKTSKYLFRGRKK